MREKEKGSPQRQNTDTLLLRMSPVPEDVAETIYEKRLSLHQIQQIRICSISSSGVSILLGLVFVYFFGMIHPTRRHFRHYLVLLLIAFDFIKATSILVFSCVSFNRVTSHNKALIQGIGWLTVFGIEGADVVILMFAVHMALLIFNPQLTQVKQKLVHWIATTLHVDVDASDEHPFRHRLARTGVVRWTQHMLGRRAAQEKHDDDDAAERGPAPPGVRRRSEGGLYRHRYSVLLIAFLFPVLVSSVSFYIKNPYEEYVYWSFFRVWTGPWYFSWTLRHVIVVLIMFIYISIYVYVMSQFKSVSRSMKKRAARPDLDSETSNAGNSRADDGDDGDDGDDDDSDSDNDVFLNTFGDSVWYKIFQLLSMLVFPDVRISAKLHGHGLTTNEDLANIERLKNESIINESVNWSNNNGVGNDVSSSEILGLNSSFANVQNKEISKQIQSLLYEEAMQRFATRKSQIMRQMKVIFIYPISYIILWLLPFINHYQVIRTGTESLWSTAPSAIFQALNCFVDVLVFLLREKPWQLTKGVDDISGMSPFVSQDSSSLQSHGWRRRVSWLPGYGGYSDGSEGVESADLELEKGSFSNQVAYGRNSQTLTLHGNDQDDGDYLHGRHLGSFEEEKDTDSMSRANSKGYTPSNDDEDGNDQFDQEVDLKDFLNSNSPSRSSQRKKRVNYHSSMGRPRSKPNSLSMTPANPTHMDTSPTWGARGSLSSSNRSNVNGASGSRRNSHLSWRTWSFGSSPSNTAGRQKQDKELDPIFGSFINDNNAVDSKLKLKENSNDVNWNLHMFDHGQRRVYDSRGNVKSTPNNVVNYSSSNSSSYRHNSGSSNNGSYSNGSNNMNNGHRGNNNHNNSNAGFDEEMDLMDFLKLGQKG